MRNATLYLSINGEYVPVSPCTVQLDPRDPGVFVVKETDQKKMREGKTVTFWRIGTLPDGTIPNMEDD